MLITEYSFTQTFPYQASTIAWTIQDLHFADLNLIVGKNATGKSKILGSLDKLAQLLSNKGQS